jgi:hypothetical protein
MAPQYQAGSSRPSSVISSQPRQTQTFSSPQSSTAATSWGDINCCSDWLWRRRLHFWLSTNEAQQQPQLTAHLALSVCIGRRCMLLADAGSSAAKLSHSPQRSPSESPLLADVPRLRGKDRWAQQIVRCVIDEAIGAGEARRRQHRQLIHHEHVIRRNLLLEHRYLSSAGASDTRNEGVNTQVMTSRRHRRQAVECVYQHPILLCTSSHACGVACGRMQER